MVVAERLAPVRHARSPAAPSGRAGTRRSPASSRSCAGWPRRAGNAAALRADRRGERETADVLELGDGGSGEREGEHGADQPATAVHAGPPARIIWSGEGRHMPLQVVAISSREGDEAQGKVNGRAPDGVGGRRFSAPGGNSPSISSDESDSQDGVSRLRRRETSTSRRAVVGTCSARLNSTRSEGCSIFTPISPRGRPGTGMGVPPGPARCLRSSRTADRPSYPERT